MYSYGTDTDEVDIVVIDMAAIGMHVTDIDVIYTMATHSGVVDDVDMNIATVAIKLA